MPACFLPLGAREGCPQSLDPGLGSLICRRPNWGTWGIGGCHTDMTCWFHSIDKPVGFQKESPSEAILPNTQAIGQQGRCILVSPMAVWAGKTEWGQFGITFTYMFKLLFPALCKVLLWGYQVCSETRQHRLLGLACSCHSVRWGSPWK